MMKRAMNPVMTPTSWRMLYGLAGQVILSIGFVTPPSGRTVNVPAGQVIMVGVAAIFYNSFCDFSPRLVIVLMRNNAGLHG